MAERRTLAVWFLNGKQLYGTFDGVPVAAVDRSKEDAFSSYVRQVLEPEGWRLEGAPARRVVDAREYWLEYVLVKDRR